MTSAPKPTRDEYLNRLRLAVETSLTSSAPSRHVSARTGVSHAVVCRIRKRAAEASLDWATVHEMPTLSMYELLARTPGVRQRKKQYPDLDYFVRQLTQPGMTKEWAHAQYKLEMGDQAVGLSRFCQLLRNHRRAQQATMTQTYEPGYRLEMDFSGVKPEHLNRKAKLQDAELLTMVWPYTGMSFACCVPSQAVDDVIAGVLRGLRFFGGAPRALVPDNFAAAVLTAGTEKLRIQPDFLRMAEAHQIAVLPARPYSPTNKGAVENQVRRLQQYLLPELALRTYRSYEALDEAVAQLVAKYNDRPLSEALRGTRREEFEEREKPVLQPLPDSYVHRHHIGRFKVAPHCRIRVLDNFYSVPHELVGQYVEPFVVDRVVEIMHEGEVVATHDRRWGKLEYVLDPAHEKEAHRAHRQRDRKGIEAWAHGIGPNMSAFVAKLFASGRVSEQALPAAQAVHSAAQAHQPVYLERVAAMVLELGMTTASDFKRFLRMMRHDGLVDAQRPRLLPRPGFPSPDRLLLPPVGRESKAGAKCAGPQRIDDGMCVGGG